MATSATEEMSERIEVLRSGAERLEMAADELAADSAKARQKAAEQTALADEYERIIGRVSELR